MPILVNKVLGNGTETFVVEVPNTHPFASMNIVASNTNAAAQEINIKVSSDTAPDLADTIEPGALIPAKGRYELSCRLVAAGERIYVTAQPGVAVRVELNLAIED